MAPDRKSPSSINYPISNGVHYGRESAEHTRAQPERQGRWIPGVTTPATAALLAWGVHALVTGIPLLTAAVALGILVGQLPFAHRVLTGALAPVWA